MGFDVHHELGEFASKDPTITVAHNINIDKSKLTKFSLCELYESRNTISLNPRLG